MRMTFVTGVLCLMSFLVAGTVPAPADATTGECQRTLDREYRIYVQQRMRALQQCEDKIVQGKAGYSPGLDCRTDPITMGKIANHAGIFRHHVQSDCGGKNRVCNAADTGNNADVPLAAIGWNLGTCPDFEGSGCTNAITDCNGIADCIFCVTDAAQSQTLGLDYHALNVPTTDRALRKCQREIGKRSVDFFRRKVIALETCERKIESGDIAGPCPDPMTQQHITAFEQKAHDNICNVCGGADKACGGAADRTTTEIGFTSTCLNVTIPGGASCGGAIATVDDIATCVDCVAEFKADCLDALSVPGLKSFPPECLVAP